MIHLFPTFPTERFRGCKDKRNNKKMHSVSLRVTDIRRKSSFKRKKNIETRQWTDIIDSTDVPDFLFRFFLAKQSPGRTSVTVQRMNVSDESLCLGVCLRQYRGRKAYS